MAWDRIHPRLTTRSPWIDHTGELPIIEGTLIRLQVDRLPGGGDPLPLWLWSSATGLDCTARPARQNPNPRNWQTTWLEKPAARHPLRRG